MKKLLAGVIPLIVCNCAFYTFSGSTLPSHLKTVEIPLFFNESLQPGVAELITEQLSSKIVQSDLLDVVSSKGDAVITGKVIRYENNPYSYGAAGVRDVDVSQYAVRIAVEVEFMDNKKDEPLYKGTITGLGVYDYQRETEEIGKRKAVADIVEQILQNSVQSW